MFFKVFFLVRIRIQYLELLFLFSFWSIFCYAIVSRVKWNMTFFALPPVGIKQKKIKWDFVFFIYFWICVSALIVRIRIERSISFWLCKQVSKEQKQQMKEKKFEMFNIFWVEPESGHERRRTGIYKKLTWISITSVQLLLYPNAQCSIPQNDTHTKQQQQFISRFPFFVVLDSLTCSTTTVSYLPPHQRNTEKQKQKFIIKLIWITLT